MIQSFIVYTFFALALFVCARGVSRTQVQLIESKGNFFSMPSNYWWCIFIFALVAGMRYDVGVDHLNYLESYIRALNGRDFIRDEGYEEGYVFITALFGKLGIHPVIYFAFLGALQLGFVLLAYRTERAMVPWLLMFIVLGEPFFTWMNGIRQMIAACIFVFSSKYIYEKRPIPFLICIILAYLWHHSVLILVPVFLLGFDKLRWKNTILNISLFIVCFILGNTPVWISNISLLGNILTLLGYDFYAETIDVLTDMANFRTFTFGPRMGAMLGTYLITLVLYPKVSDYYKSEKLDFIFKLYLIAICCYYLFVNTNMMFLRPVLYFTIFIAPMVGYTLAYLYTKKRYAIFVLLLMFSMSYTYLSCLSDANKRKDERKSYLYQFYFTEINNHPVL